MLWRRGKIPQPGARELRWIAAALIATLYCVWVSIGIGGKPLLWALAAVRRGGAGDTGGMPTRAATAAAAGAYE